MKRTPLDDYFSTATNILTQINSTQRENLLKSVRHFGHMHKERRNHTHFWCRPLSLGSWRCVLARSNVSKHPCHFRAKLNWAPEITKSEYLEKVKVLVRSSLITTA